MAERKRPLPLLLFAAGFGTRMGALTADRPKPLVPVAGKPLIDHALALADAAASVGPVVVNIHYRGSQIREHLKHRRDIRFSEETPVILETGGGLRQALPLLGRDTVLTLNTDAIWTGANPLAQLMAAWEPKKMGCLLLLLPVARATGHGGKPDFAVAADGRLHRGAGNETHVYLGAQIIQTAALHDIDAKAFSLNQVWDRMIGEGRAFGVVHDGGWCDVGHPAAIGLAEAMLATGGA
jgi:N-acetyl-alpha-D-muramate 1-phosphate uridylyltransferase